MYVLETLVWSKYSHARELLTGKSANDMLDLRKQLALGFPDGHAFFLIEMLHQELLGYNIVKGTEQDLLFGNA